QFGGDLYVGIMTIVNTVREFIALPVSGLNSGARPVMGFNYGACAYKRVKSCIKFTAGLSILYTAVMWLLLQGFPGFFIRIFTTEAEVLKAGVPLMRLFYAAFFLMSLQYAGQSTFLALGLSKQAIFFSTLR